MPTPRRPRFPCERPVVRDYRPSAWTSPVTRTIARSAAAPMMSESRGMIVMPVNCEQETSRRSSASICAFYTALGKVFHGLSVITRAPKVNNPEHRRRGPHGRLVERDRPRRSLVPGAVRPDEPAGYCPPTPAVRGSGVLRAVDAGAGRQAPDRARGAAAGRRQPPALALDRGAVGSGGPRRSPIVACPPVGNQTDDRLGVCPDRFGG